MFKQIKETCLHYF